MTAKPETPTPLNPLTVAEYIREELEALGWSPAAFAERAGLRPEAAEELIAGRRPVTRLMALCIARAFGTSVETWVNLEKAIKEHNAADAAEGK